MTLIHIRVLGLLLGSTELTQTVTDDDIKQTQQLLTFYGLLVFTVFGWKQKAAITAGVFAVRRWIRTLAGKWQRLMQLCS